MLMKRPKCRRGKTDDRARGKRARVSVRICCRVGRNAFPQRHEYQYQEELEEERRLFYVAITRAKTRLWLSYANSRYRFGNLVQNEPSRFLQELPEDYLDKSYSGGGARNQSNSGGFGSASAFDRMNGASAQLQGQNDSTVLRRPGRTRIKTILPARPTCSTKSGGA